MKKNVIYKSIGLYNKQELEQIKNEYDCRDVVNGEYNDIDDEDLQDYNDAEWDYSFGDDAEWKDSWVNDTRVAILGNLGLWNGPHKIIPKQFGTIMDAIYACIEDKDEFEIYEDQYGNLKIDAYHHDGCNHYIIKKFEDGKQRCLHFIKLWDKYNKEFNEEDDPF